MSETGQSNCNADTLAGNLFDNLTAGTDFSLPAVDLNSAQFQAPVETGNELYGTISRLEESDLTSRAVGGSGLFDGMMDSINAHLKGQYDKGRLTGSEFSSAYVALTQSAMQNSVQFLLNRDNAYWQAQVAQKQAQAAQVQLVSERVNLETAKANLAAARTQSDLLEAQYALAKLGLATEDAKYCLIQAQKNVAEAQAAQSTYETNSLMPAQLDQLTSQTARLDYEVASIMPAELSRLNEQVSAITADIALTGANTTRTGAQTSQIEKETEKATYDLSFLMPAQLAQLTSETARLEYERNSIMPAELSRVQKQVDAITADISMSTASKDKVLYETANILPSQKDGIVADTAIKTYQLTDQLPAQVAGVTEDTRGKAYNVDFVLPAQLENMREQAESHRAKTMDTRLDGFTLVTGAVGKQKELHQQQIDSYKRDAEYKVGKMILDTWTVQKSIDEGLPQPTNITNSYIDTAMDQIRSNLGL